jgi:RimJ/RimL family protein N-acetyltransferase
MTIQLRPFTTSDFPRLIGWIESNEMLVQWAGPTEFVFPLTDDQLRRYLSGGEGEHCSRRIFTAETEDGGVCGHIELDAIRSDNQTASLCRVFLAPDYRGQGLCTPMVEKALAFGFEELGLRRIELRVFGFNSSAIRCYERSGFVREGLLRKSQKVGNRYWDTVVMAILREEWEITHHTQRE